MKKIEVAVLGATGAVGQRFIQLLVDHPWFEITALAASETSAGKKYNEACNWVISGDPPASIGNMVVQSLKPNLNAKIAFSALPASIATEVEPEFAKAGYIVCSNASSYRYEPDVPLLIPEVNAGHVKLIERQKKERGWSGYIMTNPNCTTTGIAIALKPLHEAFQIEKAFIATMQAVSGAGYPGVASLDIIDNVLPFIGGEEEKIEKETRILLGEMVNDVQHEADICVSAQANRVNVLDGHTMCLSLKFKNKPTVSQAIDVLNKYKGDPEVSKLPSAPEKLIHVRFEKDRPQPRRDRDAGKGMSVSVGRIRPCPLFDIRMLAVVHNTLRGAASGSILNAEMLVSKGYLK